MDERIEALKKDRNVAPEEGSPGNWRDLITGEKFHYTQVHLKRSRGDDGKNM